MTTRRNLLLAAGAATGTVLLGGCTDRPAPAAATGPAVPDVLLAETATGLGVVRGGLSPVAGAAVATPAGTRLYATQPLPANRTALSTVDGATGRVTSRTELSGAWVPRVVSPDGSLVALTAPGSGGRTHTTILVTDATGERYRLELAGNYEPDAFARQGTGLCVLDWLPPAAPDRYRVKLFNLAGEDVGLLTRDKVPVPPGSEQEMSGQRREAAFARGAQVLYTLYTHQGAAGWDEETDAFVHTLDLTVGWAYCLDLPHPFGTGPAPAHTIAVTPDERSVLVADLTHGKLAIAATDTLTVASVVTIPTGTGAACSTVSADSHRLFLGIGADVHVLDLDTREPVARWDAGAPVHGLALSRDGHRLLVGYPDGVTWRDSATGTVLGRAALPGLTRLVRTL